MSHQSDVESINASLQTIGARIKEHRDETNVRIQHLEQIVAGREARATGVLHSAAANGVAASVLSEASTELDALRSGVKKNVRASLASFFPQAAAITTDGLHIPGERDGEVYGPMRRAMSVRDLLPQRPTAAPSIEYLRGTRTGAAAIQAAEGDAKAELALDFTLHTAPVKTIACWVPASRQALDDSTMLADVIDGELRDALRLAEDAQLLSGNGTGANMLGLMATATAYNRAVAGDKPNDTLRRAITQVQLARGVASGIIVSPQALELLELEKDADGNYVSTFGATADNGRAMTWRVPVVVTDAMAADGFLVGDFIRAARLYDRQQATVEIATQHADFFTRNLLAILAEERVALTIPRPDLLVTGQFA